MSQAVMDEAPAHRRFAAECFNHVWTLLEKPQRTADDDEEMIHCAHASVWHWSRRSDQTPTNRAIGAWQLARVYAQARRPDDARRYARHSLDLFREHGLAAFFAGYACEAHARADAVAGDRASCDRWLAEAQGWARSVTDPGERQQLLNDLETVRIAGV